MNNLSEEINVTSHNTNDNSDCEIFTVANDKMAKNLASLLYSLQENSNIALSQVRVIPFDDNIQIVSAICHSFNVQLLKPIVIWDNLGKDIFKDEEYRVNVPAWRYFRKLNTLSYAKNYYLFLDANSIILSSLIPIFNALKEKKADVVFGNHSAKRRNFKEPLKMLLNIVNPDIGSGINAGFWASKFDIKLNEFLQRFMGFNMRPYLTQSPEQSVLSIALVLSGKKLRKLHAIYEDLCNVSAKNQTEKHDNFVVVRKRNKFQKVVAMKWTGNTMKLNDDMPNKALYLHYLSGAIDVLIQSNPVFFSELTKAWLNPE